MAKSADGNVAVNGVKKNITGNSLQKICLITGANSGIGYHSALAMAQRGYRVAIACRDAVKGAQAREALIAQSGLHCFDLFTLDIASNASIKQFIATYTTHYPHTDVLINNAGINNRQQLFTEDDIEAVWATNVLGMYKLSMLLQTHLAAAGSARIVNVSSEFAGFLNLDDPQFLRRRFSHSRAYAQSRQAIRMLTVAFAELFEPLHISVNSCHPGVIKTNLTHHLNGWERLIERITLYWMGKTAAQGADTQVWLASAPEAAGASGLYWVDRKPQRCRFAGRRDERVCLFNLCAAMSAPLLAAPPQTDATAAPITPVVAVTGA